MIPWQAILAVSGLLLLSFFLRSALRKHRDYQYRNATRKLELVLQPRETIKCICSQKKGRVILTSKRLLRETGEGFTAVALKDIKKVQGTTKDKKTTTAPAKMHTLTVKAGEDWVIYNTDPAFPDLAKQLLAKVRQQNARKQKKT